ncbi:MAG: ribonuclease HIII [bacterium]|nr:ribonuclease HIII [bacterium]
MSQQTLVVQVPRAQRAALEKRFEGGAFEFRSVPHALFSVKGEGAVATLYKSGKLVVQSADPLTFLARFTDLELEEMGAADEPAEEALELDGTVIGSDEAGKGDYFGPLVVAAVRLEEDEQAGLVKLGITDSKQLSDDKALRFAAYLRERVPHSIQVLDPADYNGRYPNYTGLNAMLADLHADAIRELAQSGARVLVDQFAKESVMREALAGTDMELFQAPRAERHVAVAAASVLARAEFLLRLDMLSSRWEIALHKGAGLPVDAVGAEFCRAHGEKHLGLVAKLHFKNTGKIESRLDRR